MTGELPAKIGGLEVVSRIGEGGFGVVYLAHDPRLGRNVAIKVAHPGRGDLWREARAAARLAHANVVAIHEVGDHEGSPYLVMEYVDGPTLRDYLGRGPIPLAEALRIARDLARALAAAHREGIAHADLTPSNVLLSPDGRARVVDFGLARTGAVVAAPVEVDASPGPIASIAAGTPTYMAPEQWRREQLGPPVDLWALGAIMHVLVTGAPPVEGSSDLVRERIASSSSLELTALSELPREVAAILRRCLRKDPAARPQAAEVAAQLDAVLAQLERPAPFRDASDVVPRDAVATAIATLVERERVVTVVGAAGAGKTCALHGAVARLRRAGWKVICVRPSLAMIAAALDAVAPGAAIATLDGGAAHALSASRAERVAGWSEAPERFAADLDDTATAVGGRLVLVIDPLEDLEALPEADAAALAAALVATIADDGAARLVFAAREDRVTVLAKRIGDLGAAYALPPPTPDELREMLARPVHDAGFAYEPGLVERIVDDLAGDPRAATRAREIGALLWERRDRATSTIPYAAYAPRPRRRRAAAITGVLALVAAGGLAVAMRTRGGAAPALADSGSCTTFYYPTQTRITALNAPGLQDSLAGVSADGETVLQYRRDCDVPGSWRLLLLERQGDRWIEHVLSDLPAFERFHSLEYATTLSSDALAIVGVNPTLTAVLETSRSARGRMDFTPPVPGAFANITVAPPASIRHPALSHDGHELFYTVFDPAGGEQPYWIYRAARSSRTEVFPPGEKLDGHFMGMAHVNGLSADGLTMFVGENTYVVRVFTRKRRGDPFVNPNSPMSPQSVPGFRTRPLADCNILIGTCTTGCNGEDNCYFTR